MDQEISKTVIFTSFTKMLLIGLFLLIVIFSLSGCQNKRTDNLPSTQSSLSTKQNDEPDNTSISFAIGEWPPYTGENLKNFGCDAQVVSEVFDLYGIKTTFGFFPWARSYYETQTGSWDGTFEWADTPQHREDFFISQEKISDQEWVFFYRKTDSFDWNTMDDLIGLKIGLTSGYAYSDLFAMYQDNPDFSFEEAASDLANFQKLLSARIDIFPMEQRVGKQILENNFSTTEINELIIHPKPIYSFEPYLLLNKQNPENEKRIQLFDEGLIQLKQSGRYDQIMDECVK